MYKINPPKIHLSTVIGYDVKKKTYLIKDEQIFDTEKDLICFLAEHHYPVCNWDGKPIRDRFELPHPTCVGWGFYGLMPVKPRLVQLRVYLTKLETIHPKISRNSSLSVWCPGEPVRPYTCHVTRLACARGFLLEPMIGLSKRKTFRGKNTRKVDKLRYIDDTASKVCVY